MKFRALFVPRLHLARWIVLACCASAASATERELIRDPHFQRGFILLAAEPGKRVPYGTLAGLNEDAPPIWDLCQWSSQHPFQATENSEPLPGGGIRFKNQARSVALAKAGTEGADLILGVNASREYGTRARRQGEPWVHLLAQQGIEDPPSLAEIDSAMFHVEARLLSSVKIETPDHTPNLHAAQFQVFFSIQNLNRQSPGYGQYLWFGIPIYDNRHRVAPAHKSQDTGGTKMFIFTPSGDTYTSQSAHDGQWIVIHQDLWPLLREGLETAWSQGFLSDSKSLADYRIAGMNLGWEVPGIFDVAIQSRNLSLKANIRGGTAILSPAGGARLERDGKELGRIRPSLFEVPWQLAAPPSTAGTLFRRHQKIEKTNHCTRKP